MARLDLNLRPGVASTALEWCRGRVDEGDTDEHRRRRRHHHNPEVLLLEEDIARLKEELQKIEPFRRDLSSIIAVVAYVIKHLEEEAAAEPRVDVVEVGDRRRIATETMNNREEEVAAPPRNECRCFTALALSGQAHLGRNAAGVPLFEQKARPHRGRKRRRRWSRDLHRRFVDALQKLGGPRVATPKLIRGLMKERGLTNDEVKSHLQKYRLRVKNKSSSAQVWENHQLLPCSDHCSTDSNEVGDLEIESGGWRI